MSEKTTPGDRYHKVLVEITQITVITLTDHSLVLISFSSLAILLCSGCEVWAGEPGRDGTAPALFSLYCSRCWVWSLRFTPFISSSLDSSAPSGSRMSEH